MQIKISFLAIIIALFAYPVFLHSMDKRDTDSLDRNFLERKPSFKAIDLIKGDTTIPDTSVKTGPLMPGGPRVRYEALQDSAYYRDLAIKIPVITRLSNDLKQFSREREARVELLEGTPWQYAAKNIEDIPRKMLEPSPEEVVHYQEKIRRGMYAPGVHNLIGQGLSVSISDLATFAGIIEDVSPEIKYSIDYPADITITIYSVNAKAVAVIFDGKQLPGNYKVTWNFRDDNGKILPSGDYVAEVKIGNEKYVRKRIVKP